MTRSLRACSVSLLLCTSCGGAGVVTLAPDETPGTIAVDASNVYWANFPLGGGSSIRKVPIAGGTPSTVFAGSVTTIASDGTNLYWVGDDAVMKLVPGGAPIVLASARSGRDIAVQGSDVFWTDAAGVHKRDATGATVTLFAGPVSFPGLAVSGGNVYFRPAACPPCGREIAKVSVDGGPAVTVVSEKRPGDVGTIAADASSVYWTVEDRGALSKVPVAGGEPANLFVGDSTGRILYRIWGVASDATGLYWTLYDDTDGHGSVMKLDPTFGHAIVLDGHQWRPSSIAVDAMNVYWGNGGTDVNRILPGSICKRHK